MSKSFRETFETQTGRTTDKWESYLTVYDEAFEEYRDRSISLLEIGIQNGGSLEVHAWTSPQFDRTPGATVRA